LSDFCLLEDKDALKLTQRTPPGTAQTLGGWIFLQAKEVGKSFGISDWLGTFYRAAGDWVVETTTSLCRVGRLVNGR